MSSPKPSSAATAITTAATTSPPAATPRKRRRRAVATGAAEDCFTCRQRQAKCDRRRPYCTQCIDMGKECSGYRTTLTWGVGVASRGKLRGMSCPVPKSPSSAVGSMRETSTHTTARKPSVSQPSPPTSTMSRTQTQRQPCIHPGQKSPSPIHSPTAQEYATMDATSPVHIPPPAVPYQGWHLPSFGEHMESFGGAGRKSRPQLPPKPLQRLHTSLAAPYDDSAFSTSTGPRSSHSDSALGDYPSPIDFPGTPDDFHFADPIMHSYPEHLLPSRTPISSTESLIFPDAPRSFPVIYEDLSSSISSDQSLHELHDIGSMQPQAYSQHPGYQDMLLPRALGAAVGPNFAHISDSSYSRGTRQITHERTGSSGRSSEAAAALAELSMAGPRHVYSANRHLSPRMQVLMDYYDRMICPALVAYDGPSNPYRMHVMGLAMESQALRNAIAALAVNNIRMRQNSEARFVALSTSRWPDASTESWTRQRFTSDEIREMHGEPSEEERHYKTTSIQLLNQELADPMRAQHDSVLATLLVLCLFHVSDSGFSKFRTQFEGVKRLLSMRDREQRTSFTGWIEMFFTWFDVMTSTVNDRETQVRGELLDVIAESNSLGALEHLVGCDGRLLKIIARLGRLNLLSQNRPVSPREPDEASHHLDGNGWATPLAYTHTTSPLDLPPDQRHQFWAEWHNIRHHLQQWELDPTQALASMCSAAASSLDPHRHDLLNLSESFRYAALLYIERLAHPSLPSSSLNFQNLVAQALYHVSQIAPRSPVQKFLLWPLFITGTECIDESHRAMVRAKCVGIMRRSGFWNNLRGLEVLESVWSREDGEASGADVNRPAEAAYGVIRKAKGKEIQAFRWRRAMERTDGEYMLV